MRIQQIILCAILPVLLVSCLKDKKLEYALGEGVEKEQAMPQEPAPGGRGFGLSVEEGSIRSILNGKPFSLGADDLFYLHSAFYKPMVGDDGSISLDVTPSSSDEYMLFCMPRGSRYWFREGMETPLKDLIIPYSQFYRSTADSLASYPLYGKYSSGEGISLREVISAVAVQVNGSGKLASVHLAYKGEKNIAGVASFDPENDYTLDEGVNFVNLNCTDGGNGVVLSPAGSTFYLIMAPGNYPDGFTLTLTDMSHKGQVYDIPGFGLKAGELKSLEPVSYAPDDDLLFFEHFDNFVWGGSVRGGRNSASYAPDNLSEPDIYRTGYEEAFVRVATGVPGSAPIQDKWGTANGWTVGERHSVVDEYITSRNIADYTYLFRCQEYQGCMLVGGGTSRGGLQPVKDMVSQWGITDLYFGLHLSFDVCLRYGSADKFCTQLAGNGIATRLVIDGEEVQLQNTVDGNNTYSYTFQNVCSFERKQITPPSSELYTDGWHHVEVWYENLNEFSTLGLWGFDSGSVITHGAFVDNVEIRYVPLPVPQKRLRVLLFNLQNGMWADQGNNFNNFVAWVKKLNPDVCVFCEAQSLWATGQASPTGYSSSQYFLFKNRKGAINADASTPNTSTPLTNAEWEALAKRFGHNYHAVAAYKDGYPQVITSKTPVTTIKRIFSARDFDGKALGVSHGAGHFQITAFGKTVNVVTMHMWPQKYYPGRSQAESAAKLEGYEFAAREVEGILGETIGSGNFGEDWLLMGDTNSISPVDDEYYSSISYTRFENEGEKWTLPHKAFRNHPYGLPLYDMLREGAGSHYTGTGRFMPSTSGQARIDIMYGSKSMCDRVSGLSLTVYDSWSAITSSEAYDPDSDGKHAKVPSDHRPLLIEFDFSK